MCYHPVMNPKPLAPGESPNASANDFERTFERTCASCAHCDVGERKPLQILGRGRRLICMHPQAIRINFQIAYGLYTDRAIEKFCGQELKEFQPRTESKHG